MSYHLLLRFIFLIIYCLLLPISQASETIGPKAPINPLPQNTLQQTFSFLQLNGQNGLLLKGTNASTMVYLPVMPQWDLQSVNLHFLVYRTLKRDNPNTLTLLINDAPINSIQLFGGANEVVPWDITLPKSLLQGNIINLKITSNLVESGEQCSKIANPTYWVVLSGDSTITYHYGLLPYVADLRQFPYPFIKTQGLEKDTITLSVANLNNVNTLQSLLYVANSLGAYKTWRGLQMILTTNDQLANLPQQQKNNIIMVGTAQDLKLGQLPIQLPLTINAEQGLLHKTGTVFAPNEGAIILTPSPWAPTLALLIITGNSDEAVKNAALTLRKPNLIRTVLYPGYAEVTQPPAVVNIDEAIPLVSLAQLGHDNQFVYGTGGNTIEYQVDLTNQKKIRSLVWDLNYSASPFLGKNSYLSLKVNGAPVGGILLAKKPEILSHWKVIIPGNMLTSGLNTFSFLFTLRLPRQNCSPEEQDLAWASIQKNTQIKFNYSTQGSYLYLTNINSLFKNNLIISLPQNLMDDLGTLQQLTDLITDFKAVGYIMITADGKLTNLPVNSSNVIYIGDKNLDIKQLPIYYQHQKWVITPPLADKISVSDEPPTGIIELLPSPFNQDQLFLGIFAKDQQLYPQVFKTLTENNRLSLTNGNIAVIYANKTFVSLQSQKLLSPTQPIMPLVKGLSWTLLIGLVVALGIVLVVIGLAIKLILRKRNS